MSGSPAPITPVTHAWRPSGARRVVLDGFQPLLRGCLPTTPAPLVWPAKDPADVLDFEIDIIEAIAGDDGDTIVAVGLTFEPAAELAAGVIIADGSILVIWLSGGVAGTTYVVQATISTASGRTIGRAILLPVQDLTHPASATTALTTLAGSVVIDQFGNPILVSN